ncbi:MAG: DNA repair protein RecO [Bacteroidia bacterium]|nr:DNA repair protein RecO [Bacteroidia bacterium]
MLVKTEGVILHRFKYGNSSVICKIFTRDYGLQSFLFQGISSNRGKIKSAHLTPLNLLQLDFYHHPVKNLKRAKELVCSPILHSLHTSPAKRALGGFIQEILSRCISEEEINAPLYDLVNETILKIENSDNTQDWLPHLFMIRLCRLLGHGIFADDYSTGKVFNIADGDFSSVYDVTYCMSPDSSEQFALLLSNKQANFDYRKELLHNLVRFMQYHVIGAKPIQSLDIFGVVMR